MWRIGIDVEFKKEKRRDKKAESYPERRQKKCGAKKSDKQGLFSGLCMVAKSRRMGTDSLGILKQAVMAHFCKWCASDCRGQEFR